MQKCPPDYAGCVLCRFAHQAFNHRQMSSVGSFELASTVTVSEGYDLTTQQHHSNTRGFSFCRCLASTCSFRVPVWRMLLFLFIAAVLITVLGLVTAMFGPGNTDSKYSKKTGTDALDNTGKHSLRAC